MKRWYVCIALAGLVGWGCGATEAAPPRAPNASQAAPNPLASEYGYELWLRYPKVADPKLLASYQAALKSIVVAQSTPTLRLAQQELERGLKGLLGVTLSRSDQLREPGSILLGTPQSSAQIAA